MEQTKSRFPGRRHTAEFCKAFFLTRPIFDDSAMFSRTVVVFRNEEVGSVFNLDHALTLPSHFRRYLLEHKQRLHFHPTDDM
jgi:hypothetical protein